MLSPEPEDRLLGKDDDTVDTTGADDPQSSYVDDFEEAEEEGANVTAPFSFLGDDHDTAIDLDAAVQLSIMSTIDEERSSEGQFFGGQSIIFLIVEKHTLKPPCILSDHSSHITPSDPAISQADPTSTNDDPESRIPDELRGLTHHFQGDEDDESTTFSEHEEPAGSRPQNTDESHHHHSTTEEDDDSSMDAIMKKLALLENTQTLLENVLDANYEGRDDDNVELVVKQALSQLKLASNRKGKGGDDSVSETATMDDSSLKEEMEALQKLLDNSLPEEEGGGEAAAAPVLVSEREQGQRQIDQVLKEYEDLERSLYSSRLGGESCDEQESLRSDGGGAPNPTTTPHPPQFPWSNDDNEDNQTTGNEQQILNQNRAIEIDEPQKQQQTTFQPKRFRLQDSEQEREQDFTTFPMDHDHSQFMATKMKPRGTIGDDSPPEERSRTKTIQKNKKIVPPPVTTSVSAPSVSTPKTKSSPPTGRKMAESQSTTSLKTPTSANKRVIQVFKT